MSILLKFTLLINIFYNERQSLGQEEFWIFHLQKSVGKAVFIQTVKA